MTRKDELSPAPALTKGAEVDLDIDKLAFGGKALGRINGLVVFVAGALPGQRLRVRLTRKKAHFAEAGVIELLEQSPAYTPPRCRHFGLCGGCPWQNLAYEAQLHWKRQHVQECLEHLAGLRPEDIRPTCASPEQFYYRNKMEFTFAPRPWLPAEELAAGKNPHEAGGALGLHAPGSFQRVFDLTECHLQSSQTGDLVTAVRDRVRASGLPVYDTRRHTGFWRFLVLREGKNTGQTLAHLITTDQGDPKAVNALGAYLRERFPVITTLVHSVNAKKAQVAQGQGERALWGPGFIEERLAGRRFRISAGSFFQTNTRAAEALYDAVIRLAELTGGETVWDLYCGAGSIALCLADRARRVVGFELLEAAIQDAYANSRLNGVDNCQFLAGDLKDCLREAITSSHHRPPDVVITDPPRAGMHPQVIKALLEIAPRRIIAVSCNPATLARDLALLQERYDIAAVEPFDLFPHTAHIECVVRLERR
ncbi:MAG: 23S rRNA (uracil(1939)-C(5))-methyltransferase RlmD [Deltaproteobacteria bacterium]|nr:23S rRNA (uracil(1939)-C(5))-methyltransferase RlmD [Deltaproteobacteria bacterium]